MIDMTKIPEKGTMYVAYTDRIVYEKYTKDALKTEEIEEEKLLELHLFDEKREYRLIRTRMHGIKEFLVTDEFPHDDIYEEQVYVSGESADKPDKRKVKVAVVNYIRYDENDLLCIVNYRLKELENE